MLGKKELQATLAQRESALAQREAEIAVLTKRVEELTNREAQLQAELTNYRSRAEAIVSALTEAQRTAARIREEADAYKTQIVGTAYSERDAVKREAEEILQAAKDEAEQIKARAESSANQLRIQAEQQASQRQAQADAYVAEVEKKAAGLKERLRQAAEEARQQAAAFGSFVQDIGNSNTGIPNVDAASLPEDYTSPATLMRNIYALQGRTLPGDEPAPEPQQEPIEPKPQAQTEPEPEPLNAPVQEPKSEPQPEAKFEFSPVIDSQSVADTDALLAELMSTLDTPKQESSSAEAQVLSVSDILSSSPQGSPEQMVNVPSGLDDIIDDILRGI